jgi:hypothetical protein
VARVHAEAIAETMQEVGVGFHPDASVAEVEIGDH